jgi:dipeptidase
MLLKSVEAITVLVQSTYQTRQRLCLQSIKQGTDKRKKILKKKKTKTDSTDRKKERSLNETSNENQNQSEELKQLSTQMISSCPKLENQSKSL